MPRPAAALLLLLVASPLAWAGRPVTIDDYFTLAAVTTFAVNPNGTHVAYAESRWQASTDDRKADLWILEVGDNPNPRRLTFDRANDRHITWAGDSSAIYFLGNRKRAGETAPPYDGSTQVWRITVLGNDPQPVTRVPGGVSGYDLSPKANQLFYSIDTSVTDDDAFAKLRSKFGKLDYAHGKRNVSSVRRIDLSTWRDDEVIPAKRYVREFAATADGKRLALITAIDDTVIRSEGESRVDVWENGTVTTPPTSSYRAKAASPHAWLEGLAWSPDGMKFAFCAIFDAYPAEIVVGAYSAAGWDVGLLKRTDGVHVRGYGTPFNWTADGALLALAEKDGMVNVGVGDAEARTFRGPKRWKPQVVYGLDARTANRAGVALIGSPTTMPELFLLPDSADATPRKLTNLNPQAADWTLPRVKHITWKAKDGATVGGVLELPADAEEGKPLPLVLAIHGGPTTSVKAAQEFDPYLGRIWLPARGYAVLCPNYRGSTGNTDQFLVDLIGKENDLDVSDIIAGAKKLIDDKIADPKRVAVLGWSNGGYLTNCLITRKDLPFTLTSASSGAGILDTAMEWGINDEPAYPKVFKKGVPWETPDTYRSTSPLYGLGNATTPTLIHVGGNDVRCPPEHSRMLYRALKEYRNVPTELVVYPGEPHGLGRLTSRRAKMEWEAAWLDKYTLGK